MAEHTIHIVVNPAALRDPNVEAAFEAKLREAPDALVFVSEDDAGIVAFMTVPCDCEGRSL